MLIAYGNADIETSDPHGMRTPLRLAISRKYPEIISLLVASGVNLEHKHIRSSKTVAEFAKDKGLSAMFEAAAFGAKEIEAAQISLVISFLDYVLIPVMLHLSRSRSSSSLSAELECKVESHELEEKSDGEEKRCCGFIASSGDGMKGIDRHSFDRDVMAIPTNTSTIDVLAPLDGFCDTLAHGNRSSIDKISRIITTVAVAVDASSL